MFIKKQLAKIEQVKLKREKEILFDELLKKYNIDPHYIKNGRYFIEYEDLTLYIKIDKANYLASDPLIFPKTEDFSSMNLNQATEDFNNLRKDLLLVKERYND